MPYWFEPFQQSLNAVDRIKVNPPVRIYDPNDGGFLYAPRPAEENPVEDNLPCDYDGNLPRYVSIALVQSSVLSIYSEVFQVVICPLRVHV